MSWDDPDDKNNPWKSAGDRGPADLDAIVRDLQRKLSRFLGGRGGGNGVSGGGSGCGISSPRASYCGAASPESAAKLPWGTGFCGLLGFLGFLGFWGAPVKATSLLDA